MKKITSILLFLVLGLPAAFAQNSIEIPNVFTPNNDGINDHFFLRTVGFEKLSCTIVNRYGQTLYIFYGLNGSWDGYTPAGVKVPAGTYFVYVEATTESGITETRQGTVLVKY